MCNTTSIIKSVNQNFLSMEQNKLCLRRWPPCPSNFYNVKSFSSPRQGLCTVLLKTGAALSWSKIMELLSFGSVWIIVSISTLLLTFTGCCCLLLKAPFDSLISSKFARIACHVVMVSSAIYSRGKSLVFIKLHKMSPWNRRLFAVAELNFHGNRLSRKNSFDH